MNALDEIVEQIISLCYEIWLARNKLTFKGKETSIEELVRKPQRLRNGVQVCISRLTSRFSGHSY